jgi:predicted nucleic acid-binding protein
VSTGHRHQDAPIADRPHTIDCLIAATAVEHGVPLLHNDRDFEPLVRHCGLKIFDPVRKNR